MKAYPKIEDMKRKPKRSLAVSCASSTTDGSKKMRLDEQRVADGGNSSSLIGADSAPVSSAVASITPQLVVTETAIDITEQYIVQRLTPDLAADLVIMAMVSFTL